MYLYLYDSFTSQPKYETLLAAIERRVTDIGIQGKIARLSALKNARELIADAIKSGATTIIALGDDQTFAKMINVAAEFDVTLGFIPVDAASHFAKALGIPPREAACNIIAGRIIRKLDLGKINNYFFLNAAEIKNGGITLLADGFSLTPTTQHVIIRLCNIGMESGSQSNPSDGVLEAVITPIKSGLFSKKNLKPTILPFKKLSVRSNAAEDATIVMDELAVAKTPATVEIIPQKLRVIVGGRRLFE